MSRQQQAFGPKRARPPLNLATIRALALHYVGRYSTTRARLLQYLERKLRERGWVEGNTPPDIEEMANEFVRLGYVDDAAFARARADSLVRRGYGENRLIASLRHAGIDAGQAKAAAELDPESSRKAALTFAKRKRLGPFGSRTSDPKARSRATAAFIRAGHNYETARKILEMEPDDLPPEEL